MGCGSSSDSSSQDNRIDYEMEQIPNGQFNTFFRSCEATLQKAEELRSGWQDSLETMFEIAAVDYLKAPGNLSDAVRVWIWALSANHGGSITNCKPSANSESPYLTVVINNPNKVPALKELEEFRDALRTYIATCATGVKDLPEIIQELTEEVQKAGELKSSASSALNGLSLTDKAKALGKIGKNTAKLAKGLAKLKNVTPLVPQAVENVKAVVKDLPDIVKNADNTGKAALAKSIVLSCDIMQQFHPAEKKTPAEIQSIKTQAAKKAQKKEEAEKKKSKEGGSKKE